MVLGHPAPTQEAMAPSVYPLDQDMGPLVQEMGFSAFLTDLLANLFEFSEILTDV